MEKMYKRPFNVFYYKRMCEQIATKAGVQSTFRVYVRLIMKMMEIHAIFLSLLNLMQMKQVKQIIKDAVMLKYQVLQHVIVQILIHYFHNQQIGVEINIHDFTKSSLE